MITGPNKKQDGSIQLGLLLHNHQPVGNFPWVFQQVYEQSYLPMLAALERHPNVRLSLHYTGSLLDWLEDAHPEFLHRVAALVQRKQVEIVGGGYYEPILPSIPDEDKVVQIRRLAERIRRDFNTQPDGMWLAERVWEPGLPRILREAGVAWTILDDIHFKNVGLEDKDLYGYYATEDSSSVLKVYATSQALRYTIPWRPPEETIATLRTLATSDGARIIVMGDDGEKFGSWPGTDIYCWGEDGKSGWVDTFFTALEENSDWLHTTPLGEYTHQYPALGRVYLPTSSYMEMTEWALPPQKAYQFGQLLHQLEHEKRHDILQFFRGGFWRNFLVRYPEVNNQHKKMLRVHDLVYRAGATDEVGLTHLLKAQANDTYWHGLFGGIYMGHVRSAIYHHLIKAEHAAALQLHDTETWQHYEFTDFDLDTRDELLLESNLQNLYIDLQHGGSLFEWDIRRNAHNLLCVMTRRPESYHQTIRQHEQQRRQQIREKLAQANGKQKEQEAENPHTTVRTKETDLDQYLITDRYRRNSLIDHFLPPGLPLKNYIQMRYEEQGDFIAPPYTAQVTQNDMGMTVTLSRDGLVKRAGALNSLPVRVTKVLMVPAHEEELTVRYQIKNLGQARLETTFGSEWNINLLGGGNNPQAYYRFADHEQKQTYFDNTGEIERLQTFSVGNTWLQEDIKFTSNQDSKLWYFSIDTVTGSEAGFERTHQGSCLTLLWSLVIEPGQSWQVELTIHSSANELLKI
ncbi:MAG TPA: alpha-amylase/4-alpha-glucanotransferase domain-containing protein [Dictyobacter sp.]|nr:alpha-amylase/4-alpha-glucanotransferase domain-containing protein [Dictyobacter sp.]